MRRKTGYKYVTQERSRHGTIIHRFRWGRYRVQMNEPLESQEFKAHYAILRAKVEAAKAGLEVDFGFSEKEPAVGAVKAPVPAKPRTFGWPMSKFFASRAFQANASERTKYQSRRILELCAHEP